MSAPKHFFDSGVGMILAPHLTVIRWGGGADEGKYHLFVSGLAQEDYRDRAFPAFSWQCVVDDFGNLRKVQ
jgi:hypothetical protein